MPAEITFLTGDTTDPQAEGVKIIAHICNDVGAWGKGFVLALSRRWPEPATAFKEWYRKRSQNDFGLGAVQFVQVEPEAWVANMVAQQGLRAVQGVPPIRYDALETCLKRVAARAKDLRASVHMPRIGCGLAGGDWSRIEQLIVSTLGEQGIPVTVYDLPQIVVRNNGQSTPGQQRTGKCVAQSRRRPYPRRGNAIFEGNGHGVKGHTSPLQPGISLRAALSKTLFPSCGYPLLASRRTNG